MPRLTRTQKFADLREQLAHDAEQSISTPQLDPYANKLNQMQGQAMAGFEQPTYQQPAQQEQVYQQPAQPVYQQPVQPTPVQPSQPQYQQPVYQQPVQPTYQQPVQPTPVVEEVKPVEEAKFINPFADEVEPEVQPSTPSFDDFLTNTQQMQTIAPEVINTPVVEPTPAIEPIAEFENIEDNIEVTPEKEAEILTKFGYTAPVEENNLVNETFNEVNNYNQNNGIQTIDQLTNNIVDDLRHPVDNQQNNSIQYEEVKVDDEEFTKTLSLEISKIMDEVEASKDEPQVAIENVVEAEKTPSDFINSYFNVDENAINNSLNNAVNAQTKVEDTIVAPPVIEEVKEEPIEIKNINDLEATHDEIMDTIPFTVANEEDEEDEYYDEDEDDASNTVLNVILIVLIIILVAVLGLIVFYILKTKGIIG